MRSLLRSAIVIVAMLYPLCAAAEMITLQPSQATYVVGSTVVLDIMASGVNVGGFDLIVSFDPLLLLPNAIDFDAYLGGGDSFSIQYLPPFGDSSLALAELSLLDPGELIALQPGDFPLAHLEFVALKPGETLVTFSKAEVADLDGTLLSPTLGSATVTIQEQSGKPVPEPGSGLMCVAGLLAAGSGAIRHRRH